MPYWSEMVLKTMAAVGPLGSKATSTSLPASSLAFSAGISVATGTRSTMVFMSISTPRPVTAEPHSTGHTLPSRTPIFRPLAMSAADSSMDSKNFSISSSSAPAAASISSARRASTSSAMSPGMAHSPLASYALLCSRSTITVTALLASALVATMGAMAVPNLALTASTQEA